MADQLNNILRVKVKDGIMVALMPDGQQIPCVVSINTRCAVNELPTVTISAHCQFIEG
jgi:hypothetical protein